MFHIEKRVLTMFPYWLVVSVLIGTTVLSYLPYELSNVILKSSFSRKLIRAVVRQRGLPT
jgi:hypothetical protein